MAKKLEKKIEGNTVTITEDTTKKVLTFDFSTLPADIQTKFGPFGLGHKLGDAAAGKVGQEAVDSIDKVWKGLMAGDWSVRAPQGEKVSVKSLQDFYMAAQGKEKMVAKSLLEKLGVKLPDAPVEAPAAA
jgi:hypothetical protein